MIYSSDTLRNPHFPWSVISRKKVILAVDPGVVFPGGTLS